MFEIAIIDDKFPYDINSQSTGMPFEEGELRDWLVSKDWGEEQALRNLISRLLATDLAKHNDVELLAFLHPTALIDHLRSNDEPKLLIFDWEYQTKNADTKKQLVEILERTSDTFIYVYTALATTIWQLLSGEIFEKNRNRIRLLQKGDDSTSLFTSEDNIIQSVISQFKKAYEFDIQGHNVRFEENQYIDKPDELAFFESVLGKERLLEKLTEVNFEISNESVEAMFRDAPLRFYLSNDFRYLLDSGIKSNEEKYGPLTELSFLKALERFNSRLLDKVLERGISLTND